MQWWMNSVDYVINVGNRLPHSPPTNVPVTFETGVLLASLSIVFGFAALCGFPRPYHPTFELDAFRSASVDALWLSAEVAPDEIQRQRSAPASRRRSRPSSRAADRTLRPAP